MIPLAALVALLSWAVRLSRIHALWSLPLKNGDGWFLAQRVGPGFYDGIGAGLLRGYRAALFLPLALDVPIVAWIATSGGYALLICEQWIALIAAAILYNVILAHFSARATALLHPDEPRTVTSVQLSMEPRRLRDHVDRRVEIALAACLVISMGLLGRDFAMATTGLGHGHAARTLRLGALVTAWVLYLQIGLLLLKVVFVRWRMALPVRRTEDFRRWRTAWLSHHLRFFDSVRLVFGLLLVSVMIGVTFETARSRVGMVLGLTAWAVVILAFVLFEKREARRLAAVEREIRPIELVDEFPRPPIPEGRFLAGGLLYFNRDNPHALVRSGQGIALNLGHPSTYAWTGYFVGLALLMAWMVR
jgi:hypothetical protein